MTVPPESGWRAADTEAAATRLPDLIDVSIPARRQVLHLVRLVLVLFVLGACGLAVAAAFVRIDVSVHGQGMLEPVTVWPARAASAGIVSAVLVSTNDTVQRGQILVRLDSAAAVEELQMLRARLRQGQAELDLLQAEAPYEAEHRRLTVRQAEARLRGERALLRQRIADFGLTPAQAESLSQSRSHVGIESAVASVEAAEAAWRDAIVTDESRETERFTLAGRRAGLAQLRAQIAAAERRMRNLTVSAAADGVVITDGLERLIGVQVAVGEQLLEIADLRHWRATVAVTERDVRVVRVGDRVELELPALRRWENDRLHGHVTEVAMAPLQTMDAGAATAAAMGYQVLVELDPESLRLIGPEHLRFGYSAEASIVTRSMSVLDYIAGQFRGAGSR